MSVDISQIIPLITIASFIIGIISAVSRLAVRFGKMEQRLDNDENSMKEEHNKRHDLACRQTDYSVVQAQILTTLDSIKEDIKEVKEAVKIRERK